MQRRASPDGAGDTRGVLRVEKGAAGPGVASAGAEEVTVVAVPVDVSGGEDAEVVTPWPPQAVRAASVTRTTAPSGPRRKRGMRWGEPDHCMRNPPSGPWRTQGRAPRSLPRGLTRPPSPTGRTSRRLRRSSGPYGYRAPGRPAVGACGAAPVLKSCPRLPCRRTADCSNTKQHAHPVGPQARSRPGRYDAPCPFGRLPRVPRSTTGTRAGPHPVPDRTLRSRG